LKEEREGIRPMKGWAYCRTMEQVRRWFGSHYFVFSDRDIEDILENQIAPEIREEARSFLRGLSERNRERLSRIPRIIF